jgi:hypothetical protein
MTAHGNEIRVPGLRRGEDHSGGVPFSFHHAGLRRHTGEILTGSQRLQLGFLTAWSQSFSTSWRPENSGEGWRVCLRPSYSGVHNG